MLKFFSILAATLLLVAFQIGFLPGLNYNLGLLINLPLIFIVFVSFFYDFEPAILSAFLLGLFLDLYSTVFFGFFTILFLIEIFAIRFFILRFLQNKNLVVFLLINLIAVFIWKFIYLIVILITLKLNSLPPATLSISHYFIYLVYQSIAHSVIILFFYKISSRFRFKIASSLVA